MILSACVLAGGCASAPSAGEVSGALSVIAQAAAQGYMTYAQLQQLREAAKQAEDACALAGDPGGRAAPRAGRSAAVVCGLTAVDPARYGGWRGACPGADVDAAVFADLCRQEGAASVAVLSGARATADGVASAARGAAAGLGDGGLLVLYFSGHGGQAPDPSDPSEADGRSETLCLWDGPLTDNAVWSLLSQIPAGVRVWMITDSCHSGTNYRAPRPYAPGIRARGAGRVPDLLHWGGCADGQFSYGTSQGGTFTTALVDAYAPGRSYADWFAAAARLMPASQRPTCESTGRDFRADPAFQ
jgi:hypothetical protein